MDYGLLAMLSYIIKVLSQVARVAGKGHQNPPVVGLRHGWTSGCWFETRLEQGS